MRSTIWAVTVAVLLATSGRVYAQTDTMDGTWASTNPAARGLLRLVVRGSEIRAFWACSPTCDLGISLSDSYSSGPGSVVMATYSPAFADIVIILARTSADELRADTYIRFTDGSGRQNFSESQTLRRLAGRGDGLRAFPQFPLPPPKWTSRYMLPDGLVTAGESQPLGLLFDRIQAALRRAQVEEWSSYAVGEDGFAIVSRLESIQDDGRPRSGRDRWATDRLPEAIDGLRRYLTALFTARTGRYRVIVLMVTPRPLISGTEQPSSGRMSNLLREGATALPESLRARVVPAIRCEALIYEFFKASEDAPIVLVESSRLQPTEHLAGAGLWKAEDLRR